jgi:hypothetical protein
MADIEQTLIGEEIRLITGDGAKPIYNKWECDLLAGGVTLRADRVLDINIDRDYHGNYADVIIIDLLVPAGAFRTKIEPFDSTLEVLLWKMPYHENSPHGNTSAKVQTQRYRATIIEDGVHKLKTATPDNYSSSGADLSGFTMIHLQLMDSAIEQLRMKTVGGIFRDEVPANVLRNVLGSESVGLQSSGEGIRGVDLVEPSNKTPSPHLIIPHGTPLVQLADYIQAWCGGIYSTGMGCYLQKGLWYLYPEADLTRFNKPHKSLTLINVPSNRLPSIERTYRETPNQVIVLGTGDIKHFDNVEKVALNEGNGVRFTDGSKIMSGFGTYKNGEYVIERGTNTSEFLANERETGLQKVGTSPARITTNAFNEYSKLAFRQVTYVQMEWQNSNDSLIYPGMPVKLVYESKGIVKSTMGVMFRAQHFITGDGNTMVNSNHRCTSILTVLIGTTA